MTRKGAPATAVADGKKDATETRVEASKQQNHKIDGNPQGQPGVFSDQGGA